MRLRFVPTAGQSTSARPAARRHSYAYSFDRETFRGSYANRAEAVAAAESALSRYAGPAEAIWVGRTVEARVPVDQMAEPMLELLRERQREEAGDLAHPIQPGDYAVEELDRRLASLLEHWLRDHDLLPPAGVEAVSEHPIRLVEHVDEKGNAGREVSLIGDVG